MICNCGEHPHAPWCVIWSGKKGPLRRAGLSLDGVHTIPVPQGWSPEQAWEAIKRGDVLTDPEPAWANVRVVDGRFIELLTGGAA